MPQKLNKAGKMQDYIPAGNGDPSGEYGTAKGTNKNFTTSDKKKTEANVITENKSVVVGNKEKHRDYTGGKTPNVKGKKETFNLKDGYTGDFYVVDELPNGWRVDELATTAPHGYVWVNNNESLFNGKRETAIMKRDNLNSNKANIIDGDLTGKKERANYSLDDGLIRQANYSSNFYEAGDSIKNQYDRFLKEIDNFNLSDEEKTKAKTKLQQLGNEALRTQAKNISWGVSGRGNLNVNKVHKNSDTAMNKRAEFENYFNELKSNNEKKIKQAQAKTEQEQYIEAYKKANETGALEMTINGKTYVRSRKTSRTWYEK